MSRIILYTTEDGRTRIERATVNPHLTVETGVLRANPVDFDGVGTFAANAPIQTSDFRDFRTTATEGARFLT